MLCVMNSSTVLQGKELSKTFRFGNENIRVLQSINLSLPARSSLSIRGAAGGGKTTLLPILARSDNAETGELSWEDRIMRCDRRASRNEVAHRANFWGWCTRRIT